MVGALGINRTEKGTLALRYELAELGEEYMTPAGQEEGNPIIGLMEKYTKELKDDDYLHRYGKTNHAALRLITCGGSFDFATGHYTDNIVVFASLVGSQ